MKNSKLYIGFKGKNNASCALVQYLSDALYLLTNSFAGVKRDLERLDECYDAVLIFGIDTALKNSARIELMAEKSGVQISSELDVDYISKRLREAGIVNCVSDNPTQYLCNAAYWLALQKFDRKAVLIHIPSTKNMDEGFMLRMKKALG